MPGKVDWMRGLASGFLAGAVTGVVLALFTVLLMEATGFANPPELFMQLAGIVAYLAWPIAWAFSWGSMLGAFYAIGHQGAEEKVRTRSGWVYGLPYTLPQLETAALILASSTPEVSLMYLIPAILISIFLFGTLLVAFWRKKLYFHGYWGTK